jgi:hypothetical protein
MAAFYRFTRCVLPPVAGCFLFGAAFEVGCSSGSGASIVGQVPATGGQSTGGTTTGGSGGNSGTGGTGGGGTGTTGGTSGSSGTSGTSGSSGTGGTSGGDGGTGGDDGGGPPATSWGTPVAGGPTGTGVTATVTVASGTTVGTVSPDFVGFSYEKTHITNDSLNSTNTNLIGLYKLLATSGSSPVMRLGANDVDRCNWEGTGAAPTAPSGQPFTFNVVSGMVDELCSFLGATGTKIIYGVNYESDNVTAAAAEAAYAYSKCASSIIGIEIGNEINFFGSWDDLKTQWESFGTAITATPGALVIGPAAAAGSQDSLTTPFAADESAKFGDKLVLLTQHFYIGPAGGSGATAAALQTPNSIDGAVQTTNTAATTNKIPDGYRLGEINSFYGHGQQGVSDTLISGLWAIDMMYVTAENGGGGVNFHGGETGMDGTNPFYYEPIMEHNGAVVQVQPLYYGMLFVSLAGAGPMVSTTVNTSAQDFTAYSVAASGGWTSVILDNKSATSGVNATVNLGAAVTSASAIYLQGTPGDDLTASATNVTLAGASVSASAAWNRNPPYIQTVTGNNIAVYIPPASAALVRVLE